MQSTNGIVVNYPGQMAYNYGNDGIKAPLLQVNATPEL